MHRENLQGQAKRHTLLDDLLEGQSSSNKFCSRSVLTDEASVEMFFVQRLLTDLGYRDREIRPKKALSDIVVARGRSKEYFKPDFVIMTRDKPRWLLDAKSPTEDVDKWAYQGAGYALGLNSQFSGENPCLFYVITNGLQLKVYQWDERKPILSLAFENFRDEDAQYAKLRLLLNARTIRNPRGVPRLPKADMIVLKKPKVEEVKRVFNACHRVIWKTEKMNPQAAFFEFVKLMFVKLWEDKRLHAHPDYGPKIKAGKEIPKSELIFSTWWIEQLEGQKAENPVNNILFHKLVADLNEGVARGDKKPIFERDSDINLQAGTIKQVVARLESYDMFAIDEDLNGRLFETFLSATMRGEALGQYFTPRSIVKLITKLASPKVTRDKIDRVLDACCGTGGFLIEALTEMRDQLRANRSLTDEERRKMEWKVANESLFGVDAGREPPLAKIARINMYLHGDGGSRIYAADSLDKSVQIGVGDDPQAKHELEELRTLFSDIAQGRDPGFDLVLTNPPFSMDYSQDLEVEEKVLRQYELRSYGLSGSKGRPSLRSSIMFMERYADLLRPGGRIFTVIDDSILSNAKYGYARDFLREKFVIRAVISLPGDAFQHVGARAKTSVLVLERRSDAQDEGQPAVFMTECEHVGLDDVPMKTRASKAAEARENAEREIERVLRDFGRFMSGETGPWLVPASLIADRLDVKSCLPRSHDVVESWRSEGRRVRPLGELVECVESGGFNPGHSPDKVFTLLRVRYDGIAEAGDTALGRELTYDNVITPKAGDLVASNIAAALGSICVIPAHLEHTIASSEFTIMRIKDPDINPWFLWAYLRSPEVRARLLSQATGISRHRIGWGILEQIPVPDVPKKDQDAIGKCLREAVETARQAEQTRAEALQRVNTMLGLDNEWALQRLKTAKPPK